MKKLRSLIIAIFFIAALPSTMKAESTLELRSSAFIPSARLFRQIYGDVSATYGLEASTNLQENLDGWVNFDWLPKHGRSVGLKDPTQIRIANVSLGVKWIYPCTEQYKAYIGIGASFSNVWLKNKSMFFHERLSRIAVGGIIKSGVLYLINECIFLNVFLDYLYLPSPYKRPVDIGGFKAGLGLGMRL